MLYISLEDCIFQKGDRVEVIKPLLNRINPYAPHWSPALDQWAGTIVTVRSVTHVFSRGEHRLEISVEENNLVFDGNWLKHVTDKTQKSVNKPKPVGFRLKKS